MEWRRGDAASITARAAGSPYTHRRDTLVGSRCGDRVGRGCVCIGEHADDFRGVDRHFVGVPDVEPNCKSLR